MGEGGSPAYQIEHHGTQVMATSALGVVMDGIDFSEELTVDAVSELKEVSGNYSMLHGKKKEISYRANERVFHLSHSSGEKMDLIFRVFDDGVAFRYHFPDRSETIHQISEEKTSFHLPDSTKAWLEPLANVNTGYAGTNPSYEEHYFIDVDVGTTAPDSAGWAYPALFKTPSGTWRWNRAVYAPPR